MGYLPSYNYDTVESDAMKWAHAHTFLRQMKKHQGQLTNQQMRTLRWQALSGDLDGAAKGLEKLIAESEKD